MKTQLLLFIYYYHSYRTTRLFSFVDFLSDVAGDDIEFLLALGSDDSGELFDAVFLISGDNTELFELLEGVSEDLAGRGAVVGSSDTVLSFTTEEVLKGSNAQMRSQVDLSGDGSYAGYFWFSRKNTHQFWCRASWGLQGKVLYRHQSWRIRSTIDTLCKGKGRGFYVGDNDLIVLLQVVRISFNEGTSGDVLDGEREIVLKGKHE